MPIKELIKVMFHSYFVLVTGSTISMYLTCIIFYPYTSLEPSDIGGILLLSLICDLSFLIFYSKKALSKKQMILRFCVHVPLSVGIVLCFAHRLDWVNIDKPIEVGGFILLVLGVYGAVLAVSFYQDKKTADRLNDGLRKRYHHE